MVDPTLRKTGFESCPAAQPIVHNMRALLEHAEKLISHDSGMVVCWHEYTDDEALSSDCLQCAVQHASDALSDLQKVLRG